MPVIVLKPNPAHWRAHRWTPCRSRLPLMVRYWAGGEWFRDGFDPDYPMAADTGAVELGVVLWFESLGEGGIERTTWGVVLGLLRYEDVAPHHFREIAQNPSLEDAKDAAGRLKAEGFVLDFWVVP
jgi:hypothetical protein